MPMDKLALGSAIAGGAIAVALIEALLEKNILTLAEARDVLGSAMQMTGQYSQSDGGFEASQIIGALMRSKFAHRRHTP